MAKIVSFSLEEEDLKKLLELEKKYRNRSEALRAGIEHVFLEERSLEPTTEYSEAIIVVVHNHHAEPDISRLKHDFTNEIKTQVHNTLGRKCVEVFITEGKSTTLLEFFQKLKQVKKISYCKYLPII